MGRIRSASPKGVCNTCRNASRMRPKKKAKIEDYSKTVMIAQYVPLSYIYLTNLKNHSRVATITSGITRRRMS